MPVNQFPCLGLEVLGMCAYNPAQPANIYFTIGDAIAALALTLAVQNFLKPIYLFRLGAARLRLPVLISLVFAGLGCTVVAAIVPNVPLPRSSPLAFPIVWELLGAFLLAVTYGAFAYITLVPARVHRFNLVPYVTHAARLLAAADDGDRAALGVDLIARDAHAIRYLLSLSAVLERAEWAYSHLEMERRRERGEPRQINGRPPLDPFYEFAHRRELAAAYHASGLLQMFADPQFCAALIRREPWRVAHMLARLREFEAYAPQGKGFIQELGRQALTCEDSLLDKELGFEGFGHVPYLLQSLFGDAFILARYDPYASLRFGRVATGSARYVGRLNGAALLSAKTWIETRDYSDRYLHSMAEAYKAIYSDLGFNRTAAAATDLLTTLHRVQDLVEVTNEWLEKLEADQRFELFARNGEQRVYRDDLVTAVASIVYAAFLALGNRFQGVEDPGWSHAIGLFTSVFEKHGTRDHGFNPLQQHVAIKLVKKVHDNMQGFYPAVSRVLLSVVGSYETGDATRTAFRLLRDGLYSEWLGIGALFDKDASKYSDFLPPHVAYDRARNALTFTNRGGHAAVTTLSALQLPVVDFFDARNWSMEPTNVGAWLKELTRDPIAATYVTADVRVTLGDLSSGTWRTAARSLCESVLRDPGAWLTSRSSCQILLTWLSSIDGEAGT